jgi:hypothetical protein
MLSFWGDDSVLELDKGHSYTTLKMINATKFYILKGYGTE